MGDIEAPSPTRPRQTVLLSVLPSKEFASSKKGMLLIAEVVRKWADGSGIKLSLCHCLSLERACVSSFYFLLLSAGYGSYSRNFTSDSSAHSGETCTDCWSVILNNIGQWGSSTRFPLGKGGAGRFYCNIGWTAETGNKYLCKTGLKTPCARHISLAVHTHLYSVCITVLQCLSVVHNGLKQQ